MGANSLTYSVHGRIYDSAAGGPYWDYYPSLNVKANGDMIVGFSGSKSTEYIGAFFYGYRSGIAVARPILMQAGRARWSDNRFGDYSATTIDPNDDSIWTVQEYGSRDVPFPGAAWGTWVTKIMAP